MYSVCRIKKNFTYYTAYKFSIYLVTLISHRHYPTVMQISPSTTFFFIFLFEVQLIYNVMLGSDVLQSDSDTFTLPQIIFYYKLLQGIKYSYLFYIQQCVSVNPKLLIYPSPSKCNFLHFSLDYIFLHNLYYILGKRFRLLSLPLWLNFKSPF